MKPQKDKIEGGQYLTKYFTQFPNEIDDSDLDVYEFRLLLHYYRVGDCWEGVRYASKKCNMSTGKVSEVRRSLAEKGYITIQPNGDGVVINVVDKIRDNIYRRSAHERSVQEVGSNRSPSENEGSQDEHINNPLRITHKEDIQPQTADPIYEVPVGNEFSKGVIEWLNKVRKKYGVRGTIQWTKQRHAAIEARRKESNVDLPGLVLMFEHRCRSWRGTEFEKYLTPDTLFRPSKFQGYMEQAAVQPAKDWTEKKEDVLEGYDQDSAEQNDGGSLPAGFKW